jgi:hypothetical protein
MMAGIRILLLIVLAVWAGIIVGVSLMATPVKFQAPSLTLETGLEIGHYTFRLLGRVEVCLLIAALAAAAFARARGTTWIVLAMIVVIIALQRFWLLPFLEKRVSEVLAGGPPSFSLHHRIFAVMEAAKAALLILAAAMEYSFQIRR